MRQDYTVSPDVYDRLRFTPVQSAFRALLPIFVKLGVPKEVVEEWKPHVEHGA
jgi:hypothetical protein